MFRHLLQFENELNQVSRVEEIIIAFIALKVSHVNPDDIVDVWLFQDYMLTVTQKFNKEYKPLSIGQNVRQVNLQLKSPPN